MVLMYTTQNKIQTQTCSTSRSTTMEQQQPAKTRLPIMNGFQREEKWAIVGMISCCGLLPLFVSGSFFPTIPDIAEDLETTGSVVGLTVSISVLAACIGALFGATYSGFYGRKPVYLFGLPLLAIGSVGVALSPSIESLMIWRFLQTMGGAPGLSVGAGVIGDIYRLEERGTAMGIFFSACLLGPALAPFVGGHIFEAMASSYLFWFRFNPMTILRFERIQCWVLYLHRRFSPPRLVTQFFSWRIMQFGLGFFGFLVFLVMCVFFPETSIPGNRGIEKRRQELQAQGKPESELKGFVWINPFKELLLLRSPNLLGVALAGTATLITDYGKLLHAHLYELELIYSSSSAQSFLVPLAYTVGARYNIKSQAALGMCYVPIGVGNLIGAPLAGYLSDRIVVKYRASRGGIWYPEDRLRGTLIGAGLLVPLSMVGVGIGATWGTGMAGLILCLVSLFMNGIGVDLVLSPMSAYIVDILHARSAESMAANNAFRSLLMSILIAPILPTVEAIGVFWTNIIAAVGSLIFGFVILWIVIRFGDRLRAWVDVGFSTAANN
ncbi:hypothetical protein D9758_010898 [Tetrapyrgos nigripes]|uniref:Major facilitator superfamily (MFS) profile domain-containing protein n=1 Tax=Tetrapyrgos nigripes TaxID=182062 RepID=A0A8H5CUP5_9AGAR|nr:hypothetical protein D9758_010898 [Tetrapyrgos nigripes]